MRGTDPGNFADNAPMEVVDWKDESVFRYEKVDGEWKNPTYQLKITNVGFRKLFVSGLNMEANYKISNEMMAFEELRPGQSVWMRELYKGDRFKTIPLVMKDEFHSWGITETAEYLKIFISTDKHLDTNHYNQEGLELDMRKSGAKRAGRRDLRANLRIPDWVTKEIPVTIIRPMEEVVVSDSMPAPIGENCEITLPEGVSCVAKLSTLDDAKRTLGSDQAEQAIRSLQGALLEENEFGTVVPLTMSRSVANGPELNVLELSNLHGAEHIDADHPLKFNINQPVTENEAILPLGFDEDTGMLYPLGSSLENGEVMVETLPEPVSTDRSIGGSIKIFFQKVVLSRLGLYEYPQLAIAEFEEEGEEFTYNIDLNTIKESVQEANNIAIVIHGIIGNTKEMAKSLRRAKVDEETSLDSHFDLVLTFDYENLNTPIEDTAKAMKEKLASVGLTTGQNKDITVIAHSMGGLVTRWFIEKEGGNEVINHLIQLGTPNLGSPWASIYEMASMLLGRAVNGASFLKPYLIPLSFLGKYVDKLFLTLKQMHEEDSEFIKKLNDGTTADVKLSIIAGNTQLIPFEYEQNQQSLLKKLWKRFKSRGHYDLLDAFLFKTTNDIAVKVTSVHGVEGINTSSKTEVPCDHLGYFGVPESLEALKNAVIGVEEKCLIVGPI